MSSWGFDKCVLCAGAGKIASGECPICHGEGFWEFVVDDNHLAVEALLTGEPANQHIKEMCDRRLAQVTPDNLELVLMLLETERGHPTYDQLHLIAARRWGWAWTHANRFAIELVRLCGGVPTEHPDATCRLAWKWLEEENQKKIDAPLENKVDASIDNSQTAAL